MQKDKINKQVHIERICIDPNKVSEEYQKRNEKMKLEFELKDKLCEAIKEENLNKSIELLEGLLDNDTYATVIEEERIPILVVMSRKYIRLSEVYILNNDLKRAKELLCITNQKNMELNKVYTEIHKEESNLKCDNEYYIYLAIIYYLEVYYRYDNWAKFNETIEHCKNMEITLESFRNVIDYFLQSNNINQDIKRKLEQFCFCIMCSSLNDCKESDCDECTFCV